MDKINVKTLNDEVPGKTATEIAMNARVITNHAAEIIGKINEMVKWINGVDRQLMELYQQQEELLKKNKMGYWKERR